MTGLLQRQHVCPTIGQTPPPTRDNDESLAAIITYNNDEAPFLSSTLHPRCTIPHTHFSHIAMDLVNQSVPQVRPPPQDTPDSDSEPASTTVSSSPSPRVGTLAPRPAGQC